LTPIDMSNDPTTTSPPGGEQKPSGNGAGGDGRASGLGPVPPHPPVPPGQPLPSLAPDVPSLEQIAEDTDATLLGEVMAESRLAKDSEPYLLVAEGLRGLIAYL